MLEPELELDLAGPVVYVAETTSLLCRSRIHSSLSLLFSTGRAIVVEPFTITSESTDSDHLDCRNTAAGIAPLLTLPRVYEPTISHSAPTVVISSPRQALYAIHNRNDSSWEHTTGGLLLKTHLVPPVSTAINHLLPAIDNN